MIKQQLPAMPCGGVPYFDHDSGIAYRCDTCFAVIGSVGMPRSCKEALDLENSKKEVWDGLKNYGKGLRK